MTRIATADRAGPGAAKASRGLQDLQIDRVLGTPNVVVRLDREEILRHGLDPDRLARELRARIAGVEATLFNEVDQRIDIAVRFPREERIDLAGALASPVQLPGGQTVPLRSFLVLREERPVRELLRHNQRRMVTISAEVDGRSLDDVWRDAWQVVEDAAHSAQHPGRRGRRAARDAAGASAISEWRCCWRPYWST